MYHSKDHSLEHLKLKIVKVAQLNTKAEHTLE